MRNRLNQIIGISHIVITSVQDVKHYVSRTVIKGPPPHSTFLSNLTPLMFGTLIHLQMLLECSFSVFDAARQQLMHMLQRKNE